MITPFFSSFISSTHADTEEKQTAEGVPAQGEEEKPEPKEVPAHEEEEEPEPEDLHPSIREECKQSSKCAASMKHFDHCQEKVHSGHGFKGEDCVEEFMMHCVDNCVAPKLFAKLK